MSQITQELREFTVRLGKEGYPTALLERVAARMDAMEEFIVEVTRGETQPIAEQEDPTWVGINEYKVTWPRG